MTERLWLGCRPDFVSWECQQQFQGGRGSIGGINLWKRNFGVPVYSFFNFSETSWASFWELRGRQQQKIKLLMRTVHFRIVFTIYVEVSPESFFLVNRGNHQLMQWGRAPSWISLHGHTCWGNVFPQNYVEKFKLFLFLRHFFLKFTSKKRFFAGVGKPGMRCKNAMGAGCEKSFSTSIIQTKRTSHNFFQLRGTFTWHSTAS